MIGEEGGQGFKGGINIGDFTTLAVSHSRYKLAHLALLFCIFLHTFVQ